MPNPSSQRSPLHSSPPEAWEPLLQLGRRASRPVELFLKIEAASGALLLVAAAVALFWANSAWSGSYAALWETPVGIQIGHASFERSLQWVVNDCLMVLFFFVVGMEIRREIHHGELSEWRRAALPAAAALGGVVAPAGLYLLLAGAPATRSGWGVPMATDIAFAVGILALLGKRVPAALRVLLLALAAIDDLGAIVVIALFYSSGIGLNGLFAALLGIGGIIAMQRLGVRRKSLYILPGAVVWGGVYASGIHPTIAGVVVGLMTPVRAWLGPGGFLVGVQKELDRLSEVGTRKVSTHALAGTLQQVDAARHEAMSPAESLIHQLHPWVAFGVMPVFALANAGVVVSLGSLDAQSWDIAIGAGVGLVVGKPLGVLLAAWLVLRLGLGSLPKGIGFRHLAVLGAVAGVGFTMALFIAQLAFADAHLLAAAKLGVLSASILAALVALVLGRVLLAPNLAEGAALTEGEAESSTET